MTLELSSKNCAFAAAEFNCHVYNLLLCTWRECLGTILCRGRKMGCEYICKSHNVHFDGHGTQTTFSYCSLIYTATLTVWETYISNLQKLASLQCWTLLVLRLFPKTKLITIPLHFDAQIKTV